MRKLVLSTKKPQIHNSELIKDLQQVVDKYQSFLDDTTKFSSNPSVKPARDRAEATVELATSLIQHLKGNS